MVCHHAPGNPGSQNTVCVNFNALPMHMAHGDYLGPCGSANCLSAGFASQEIMGSVAEDRTQPEWIFEIGNEDQISDFEILPNPVKDQMEVHFTAYYQNTRLSIYASDGSLLWMKKIDAGNHRLKIFTSDFISSGSAGMFFISLQDEKRTHIKPFIVTQ